MCRVLKNKCQSPHHFLFDEPDNNAAAGVVKMPHCVEDTTSVVAAVVYLVVDKMDFLIDIPGAALRRDGVPKQNKC